MGKELARLLQQDTSLTPSEREEEDQVDVSYTAMQSKEGLARQGESLNPHWPSEESSVLQKQAVVSLLCSVAELWKKRSLSTNAVMDFRAQQLRPSVNYVPCSGSLRGAFSQPPHHPSKRQSWDLNQVVWFQSILSTTALRRHLLELQRSEINGPLSRQKLIQQVGPDS